MSTFDFKGKMQVKAKNRAGLDIGSSTLKIIEIATGPEKPKLLGLGLKNISGQSKESLSDAIKSLADETKISTKTINVSVSGPAVIVRFISMPKMREEELKSAVRFEAEKFIPFNIDECIVDFQTLRKDDRENKVDILLVAVKKELVEEKIALIEASGFFAGVVDVDSFALANSFCKNFPSPAADKTFALLNIGSSVTNLSIVKNDMIFLVRDMPLGTRDFYSAISKSLGIDAKLAEGLMPGTDERSKKVTAIIKNVFANMIEELRLPFSYYENQCGRSVDEIYLSGGGVTLFGLEDLFQEAFGSKPAFWDPLQFLDASSPNINKELLSKAKYSFAIASGLALR